MVHAMHALAHVQGRHGVGLPHTYTHSPRAGEAAAVWDMNGQHQQIVGPRLKRLFFADIRFLVRVDCIRVRVCVHE